MIFGIFILLIALATFTFSYFWVDLSLILLLESTKPSFGYLHQLLEYSSQNRPFLSNIFMMLISLLFIAQLLLFFRMPKFSPKVLVGVAAVTTLIFTLSYNFLSHDIFTYLFFSKVTIAERVNPYTVTPNDFYSDDLWVGFVHSVEGTYRYGITFLIYTLIPMIILGAQRFLLNFIALKLLNGLLFFLTGLLLWKTLKDKKIFALWFFNPLLIVELLINSHNDLVMISLFILSIVLLNQKKKLSAFTSLLASVATKIISVIVLPIFFTPLKYQIQLLSFISVLLILFLTFTTSAVHTWYYTWLFMFIPFLPFSKKSLLVILITGFLMLLNYAPFITTGRWDTGSLLPNARVLGLLATILIVLLERRRIMPVLQDLKNLSWKKLTLRLKS